MIHTISFVPVSVDSLELCGRDAASQNFISIGFSGVFCLPLQRPFALCQETSLGEMLIYGLFSKNVWWGIQRSLAPLGPVIDCGFKVLEPQNFIRMQAYPLLKSFPLQLNLQLCSFNKPQLHLYIYIYIKKRVLKLHIF